MALLLGSLQSAEVASELGARANSSQALLAGTLAAPSPAALPLQWLLLRLLLDDQVNPNPKP